MSFHINRFRNTEAAKVLFGDTTCLMALVRDRYFSYKRLAKDRVGRITRQGCWAHQRRDVIAGATGREALKDWLERFAVLFQLNQQRLQDYDPCRNKQRSRFWSAHAALVKACDELFAQAEREFAGLEEDAPKRQPLRTLLEHREGCVFLDQPAVSLNGCCTCWSSGVDGPSASTVTSVPGPSRSGTWCSAPSR